MEQNTGMSVSDWSGLVAMVVSLCALVSPMLTAIFNNWHQQMVCVPSRWHSTFTLTCKGDSMEPRIHDGDLVAIRSQPEVENGEIAAVRIGEEATLKHVYLHENFIELRPENPAFSSIILSREDMNAVVIEGKAVGLCRDI